jgi:dihydrofolate synthase/folylpolyglutamate synthase
MLELLAHPERRLRGALVGGTNGKGSVVALTRSVLGAVGLSVGTMPKPHLVEYRERICIDGIPIPPARFAAAIGRVLPAADTVADELGPPTEFELLTAAAVTELAGNGVDLAVIEVGMGGRLDATNALDLGVAAITNVQKDHERYLGRTLAAIGTEKAAIIKSGDLAVTGASGRGLRPIQERCGAVGVPLRRAGPRQPYAAAVREVGWEGTIVDAQTPELALPGLRLALLGSHQAANAAVALAILEALVEDAARHGHPLPRVDEAAIRAGFGSARWPGRMELLDGGPDHGRVLLDGAHNPAGARALARSLDDLRVRGFPLVFGAMRGKRVTAALRALAALRPRPVFTRVDDPNALDPAHLARAWRRAAPGGASAETAQRPDEALARAAGMRHADEPVVVAGSLYLVGAIRPLLTGEHEEA